MSSSPVISLGSWGGPAGDRWSCMATNGITEITIRENVYIKSFSFIDATGLFSGTFGNTTYDATKIPINWPSEYLTSISGKYGDYCGIEVILSLSFITNKTTYGPFGSTDGKGQAFSTPITDNVVVGFFGRSGQFLDAIGIHVQPMNATRISLGPWGGEGGDRFSFNVDPSFIKRITVRHNEFIKSILFEDSNDQKYGPFGGKRPQDTAGEEAQIEIGDSQRLTSISGRYANYAGVIIITSLSFHINDTTIEGPYGAPTGTSFTIPMNASEVVGFFGGSGWYLDSIGAYAKPK